MDGINVWAVLVAAVSAFVLGGLWYSPMLFGPKWNRDAGMSPDKQKAFQAAADKAIGWSAAEHLKREAELADGFRKQGLEVYTPDVAAFRAHAQKIYLASDEAKAWPKGMLEKINALK